MSFPLCGSDCLLRIAGEAVGDPYVLVEGVRISGWKVSQQAVDVSDASDEGWRRLLSGAGLRSLEVRLSGLYLGSEGERQLRDMVFEGTAFRCELSLDQGQAVRGSFIATEMRFESAINEEATYAAVLTSAGPIGIG